MIIYIIIPLDIIIAQKNPAVVSEIPIEAKITFPLGAFSNCWTKDRGRAGAIFILVTKYYTNYF